MSISSSEKVFVDPKDEITFVVERLLKAEKDRIILVVPQNSLLLSSIVSIDILFRKLLKTKKLAVIVTEDEYGKTIAAKAGFVVVDKVSQITSEQWNLSYSKKLDVTEVLEKRKQALLENIGNNKSVKEEVEELPEVPGTPDEDFSVTEEELDQKAEEINEEMQDEAMEEEAEEQYEDAVEESIESEAEELSEEKALVGLSGLVNSLEKTEAQSDEEAELESSLKKYEKPRREAKVVDLGGIKLISGGDIKSFIDSEEDDKMADVKPLNDMADDFNVNRKIKRVGSSSFTGKDFTRQVSTKGGLTSLLSKFSLKRRNSDFRDETTDFIKKKNRRKILLVTFIVFLLLFASGGYLLAFQFSSVDVNIKIRSQDVSTSASVLIGTTVEEASFEDPIELPAKQFEIKPENLSMSKTGTANGAGKRGNKAKGVVTIYNLETQSITLPAKTKFTNVTNNKIYLLVSAVTLDPATVASNIKTPSSKDNIALEAETFGSDFNIVVSDKTRFSIEGYSQEEELSATAFQSFEGGTSEDFVSVSEENFKALKDTMLPELKKQGLDRLKNSLEAGYMLIEQTVIYDESNEAEALPKVGEEAIDNTFNLTIQLGIKGLAVKTEDLTEAIKAVLKENAATDTDNELEVAEVKEPQIDNVEKIETDSEDNVSYRLTVSSKGSVTTQITQDQMKKDISGLSVSQANDYFRLIDYIEEYRIDFSPGFVPESLRRIPAEISRINIRTR